MLIHENTIGYHLCEYSEKGKRDGTRFVRNLVDQIAIRLPEYAEHITNNERIQVELDTRCHKDPTSCFFATIVGPLRKLKQPDNPRFVIIDALDECFESDGKTSEIIEILKSKILHFPKWLKIILTSRNLTSVTSRLPQVVNRTSLYATDERNVNDIRFYVKRFISQNSHFSRHQGIETLLDEVITQSEGNFLFVKTTLQYMNDTGRKVDLQSLPTSLFDLYSVFFDRQFDTEGFEPFQSLFEVLLAVYSPLHLRDLEEVLKSEYETKEINKRIEQVSCFLRFGRDGTVKIYHQSFAEWLINQTPKVSINKTRGHQSIAKFLLHRMHERHTDVRFAELTELFIHILSGQILEMGDTAINIFNITEMREPHTNQYILHYLVTKPTIYLPVLDYFLQKFSTVDVLDSKNKTPAFYAASEGLVRSLQSCIKNGADFSSFLKGYKELDPLSVFVRNTGIEEFSLMHVAAAKGHKDVVELLVESNISYPKCSKRYPTPLHLAAANGHLDIVKFFYDRNETFDAITLHHAVVRNHLAVVQFILSTVQLRDTCVPCQREHFSEASLKTTQQEIHTFFCETALHAAVSRGLIDIVKILLSFGKEALECKHHSGKTVLMDAVERNDTEMVDMLLDHGANVTSDCGLKMSKDSNNQMCSINAMYKQDFFYTIYCVNDSCECGHRAIHRSAKYGLWKMAEKLITHGRIGDVMDLKDCNGDSATHVAIVYDHIGFVKNVNMSLHIIGRYLVESAVLNFAIRRCSVNVAKCLLNSTDENENVWNVLQGRVVWSPCQNFGIVYNSYCLNAFKVYHLSEAEEIKKESERRLNIIKLLLEKYQETLLVLHKSDYNNWTLLHKAAAFGFNDAVKLLIELGADEFLRDANGKTPLMVALEHSPFHDLNPSASYRCYKTNDGQFSSCYTTCFDETVRYLIQSQRGRISKCDQESAQMLKHVIIKRMPLSLYALLKIGVDWNCPLIDFTSAMLLHLHVGGAHITEVLKMFEVDVPIKCGVSFSESEVHQMSYISTLDQFGSFFKPSLNKKRFPLQRLIDRHPRGFRILDECYDAGGYLPIHRAVQGGNLHAIKWFKSIGVNTQLKTQSGLTVLDLSLLYLRKNKYSKNLLSFVNANARTSTRYRNDCLEEMLRAFFDTSSKNYSSDVSTSLFSEYQILNTAAEIGQSLIADVYKKALEIIPGLRRNKYLLLDEQDARGYTALHFAALSGRENAVKYLVQLGADVTIKNKDNQTPLLIALIMAPYNPTKSKVGHRLCYTTKDGLFTSCETTPYDEIVRYLIWSQKSSISNCDDESAFFLNTVIEKRMPLSLYALLKIGVDTSCKLENELGSPFIHHIRVRGREVSKVFIQLQVDISVQCGMSVMFSELHLISFVSTSADFGNFFRSSQNKKASPLQRLIDRHPRGVRILDECYDAEGYLPIHRAAQGGNLAALRWFNSVGVNTKLKTQSGFTALELSIHALKFNKCNRLLSNLCNHVGRTNEKNRNKFFGEILRAIFNASHTNCSSFSSLFSKYSILHVAIMASNYGREVVTNVYKTALEIIPCLKRNKHLLLDEQDARGYTALHFAALSGQENAVKYLVELGADVTIKTKDNQTPMLTSLIMAPDNPSKSKFFHRLCYTTKDGLFTSCETTPHDEIVRYLIWSQKSSISKCDDKSAFLLHMVIRKRMPLSLYALLKTGVDVNCKLKNELPSPFIQHIIVGGRELSKVLIQLQVNISIQCGVPMEFSELHLISYVSASDDFGDFFGPSEMSSPLQRLIDRHPSGVRILDECFDADGYLPIHRAAQGGNLAAIKWFKSVGVNTQLKTQGGVTALFISIIKLKIDKRTRLDSNVLINHIGQTNWRYSKECFEEILRASFDVSHKNGSLKFSSFLFSEYAILHLASREIDYGRNSREVVEDVYKIALKVIPGLKTDTSLLLDEQDAAGNAPLHYAAFSGQENVVKYLVQCGANVTIKNKDNQTPMLIALIKAPDNPTKSEVGRRLCYTTKDGWFKSCETTPHDEIVRYLIWSQGSSISKCDEERAIFLNTVIKKRMPLSLYALLKMGVNVNCKLKTDLGSAFIQHIMVRGLELNKVFIQLQVDISVQCGVPMIFSELHLVSHTSLSEDFGNLFGASQKSSPLQRLIDHHPKGVRILDECYDADGYLPIHRAVQGGNLEAIKWFKSIGVDTQLKTQSGLSALDISILYLGDISYGDLTVTSKHSHFANIDWHIPVTSSKYRKKVFETLLQTFIDTLPEFKFPCGPTVEGLSPLHIAAVKGMAVLRYVHKKATEILPRLPVHCVNKHQLDPVYLAQFYDSVRNDGLADKFIEKNSDKFIWYNLANEIRCTKSKDKNNIELEFGHESLPIFQYPDRESEYLMAFNYLYHPPLRWWTGKLFATGAMPVSDCPGYYEQFPKLENAKSLPDFPDTSKCLAIPHDYIRILCINDHLDSHNCQLILKLLKSRYIRERRRRNRQFSQFILRRLGWNDDSHVKSIDDRWPFYFLHKMYLRKYKKYEYFKILNEALEVGNICFRSHPIFDLVMDP